METKTEPIELPTDDGTVITIEYYLYREDASSLTVGIFGLTEISHSDSFIQLPKDLIKFHRFKGIGSYSLLALPRWLQEKKKLALNPQWIKDYAEWQRRKANPVRYYEETEEQREKRRRDLDPFIEMFEQCPILYDDKELSDD